VLQHTPLTVTVAPPSDVTFPPLEALFEVIEDGVVVVTVGTDANTGMPLKYRSKQQIPMSA